MSELNIEYTFQKLDKISQKSISSGFLINFKNDNYIITVHHFFPIDLKEIYYKSDKENIKLDVISRSYWNEILILRSNKVINSNHKLFRINNFKLIIPKINETLFISGEKTFIKNVKYFPLGMIPGYPRIKYLELENNDNIQTNSGSPVFDSNSKIIGILSKSGPNNIYVLPIIYLLKTLVKKDNSKVYFIENRNTINKIKRYKVKSNYIFTKCLNEIPLDCYFLLEGDSEKEEKIFYENNSNFQVVRYENVDKKMLISNEAEIIKISDNKYKINIILMKYLKILEKIDIIEQIINLINNDLSEEIFLKIKKKKKKLRMSLVY
jgi:hypothetical protein